MRFNRLINFSLLTLLGYLLPQGVSAQSDTTRKVDNQFLTMTVVAGWTRQESGEQRLNLRHGKYLFTINPIFEHASGIMLGRLPEIVEGYQVLTQ